MRANGRPRERGETLAWHLDEQASSRCCLQKQASPEPRLGFSPGLCLVGLIPCLARFAAAAPCREQVTDSERFYLRLPDPVAVLIAHSPGSPKARGPSPGPTWNRGGGTSKASASCQYSIHLHRPNARAASSRSAGNWIGGICRSAAASRARCERERLWWVRPQRSWCFGVGGALASWWFVRLRCGRCWRPYRSRSKFTRLEISGLTNYATL